jgi:post-segregation antitoxin (ccd killing protein)
MEKFIDTKTIAPLQLRAKNRSLGRDISRSVAIGLIEERRSPATRSCSSRNAECVAGANNTCMAMVCDDLLDKPAEKALEYAYCAFTKQAEMTQVKNAG